VEKMNSNEYILRPPGTYFSILPHPSCIDESVEVAVVQDHRFAFFYWLKWKNGFGFEAPSPILISFDWHEDLAWPEESECEELNALNTNDYKSIATFCWEKLHSQNDGHILSAAYLDLIGDIYVLRKQDRLSTFDFYDVNGKAHVVRCYSSIDKLLTEIKQVNDTKVFFDIDLDYFTESTEPSGGGEHLQLVPDEDIITMLNPASDLFIWMFKRLAGITIATEPLFCGGLVNSNHLLSVVNDALFYPQLLSHRPNWKHLKG
jgi:hypothetical protein